jgi:hypothetical protein
MKERMAITIVRIICGRTNDQMLCVKYNFRRCAALLGILECLVRSKNVTWNCSNVIVDRRY